MKTRTIASTLVALSLGASLTACGGADTTDPHLSAPADEELGSFDQVDEPITACDDIQYDHWRHLAALAVATANELGRWNAAKDYVFGWNGLQLSSEGMARCKDGCENIKAILSLQAAETKVIPRHDPGLLKQYLQAFHNRQVIHNQNNPVPDHQLKLSHVTDANCGYRYHFNVTGTGGSSGGSTTSSSLSGTSELKAVHSGKCMDISGVSYSDGAGVQQYACSGGGNQKFTVEAQANNTYRLKASHSGKCLGVMYNATHDGAALEQRSCGSSNSQLFSINDKGSGRYELKNVNSGKCVDVRSNSSSNGAVLQLSSCHGGANQQFAAAGFNKSTSTSSTSSGGSMNNSVLWSQLKFAGEHENKYLQFQSTSTQVSIDPMGTMVDGGASGKSGSCTEGSCSYDYSKSSSGQCCVYDGKYGKLVQSAWNKNLFYCR